ncbi:hypothetical protein [Salinarimonas rosea]|uniref:hypothetical protein n=1 Tax=Salinarimonas rosea TaxID=552063 RepID=UPI000424EB58|nr:hypothetical protein [Salinarimonas rosea]
MDSIFAALISFFLVDPIQAELAERLSAAQAPQEIVSVIAGCTQGAIPSVVDRVAGDPVRALSQVYEVWIGASDPVRLLAEVAPDCSAALEAARPFLAEPEA